MEKYAVQQFKKKQQKRTPRAKGGLHLGDEDEEAELQVWKAETESLTTLRKEGRTFKQVVDVPVPQIMEGTMKKKNVCRKETDTHGSEIPPCTAQGRSGMCPTSASSLACEQHHAYWMQWTQLPRAHEQMLFSAGTPPPQRPQRDSW